jgi:hypothetical protein
MSDAEQNCAPLSQLTEDLCCSLVIVATTSLPTMWQKSSNAL